MQIRLSAEDKKANDLSLPKGEQVFVECEVRGRIDFLSPTFILCGFDEYYKYNYVFVPKWSRYYFIEDIQIDGNLQYLYCSEDVLASFYADILNATFYCIRSTDHYNENYTDSYFPAENETNHYTVTHATPWSTITGGRYIIGIASGGNDNAHIGTNVYYVLTPAQMSSFMDDLMSKAELSLSGIADSITKSIINPMQYIRSCIWLPITPSATTHSVTSIDFGWWSSDTSAQVLEIDSSMDAYTVDEFDFNRPTAMWTAERAYMLYPPYSEVVLTAYPFGRITVPRSLVSEIIGGASLHVKLMIDHITGMGSLILSTGADTGYIATCQIGVEIPVGEVVQDFVGAALNAAGAVTSVATGNVIGAAYGVQSAIDHLTPTAQVTGAAGGFAQLMLDDPWELTRYYQEIHPDGELVGEPCMQSVRPSALSGYAQFVNADMPGTMLLEEKTKITNLLESGIHCA